MDGYSFETTVEPTFRQINLLKKGQDVGYLFERRAGYPALIRPQLFDIGLATRLFKRYFELTDGDINLDELSLDNDSGILTLPFIVWLSNLDADDRLLYWGERLSEKKSYVPDWADRFWVEVSVPESDSIRINAPSGVSFLAIPRYLRKARAIEIPVALSIHLSDTRRRTKRYIKQPPRFLRTERGHILDYQDWEHDSEDKRNVLAETDMDTFLLASEGKLPGVYPA